MDPIKLRQFWHTRQGLDGSLQGEAPDAVLSRSGWARSVGGVNPYITIFARSGQGREASDAAAARLQILELPSARGCTYVVPKSDFGLALASARVGGEQGDIVTVKRHFGVTEQELAALSDAVLRALESGPMDPAALKEAAGDMVRGFGEEGKKRGVTTTLPPVLGRLQVQGTIRRLPIGGRLDQQRYAYALWEDPPAPPSEGPDVHRALADRYFAWAGPATTTHFQWFSGLGAKAAREAVACADLVEVEPGWYAPPPLASEYCSFIPSAEPRYALLAGIDSLFLLRRDLGPHIDAADAARSAFENRGMRRVGDLQDVPNHAIVDRGRLVGLWEYDTSAERIVAQLWIPPCGPLDEAIRRTEEYVRGELGDARSFSLDSPAGRRPRIEALRQT